MKKPWDNSALTIVVLLGVAQPAFGGDVGSSVAEEPSGGSNASGASGQGVEEIVVTAQKRSQRESEVPISINAITGTQLAERGITSPTDLAKVVPGFTYTPSAYGAPIFTIRGIGVFNEALMVAPTTSVYLDQVPLPYSRMAEGVGLDPERVEVLKGPQGTLFGQNSTGGAINYIAAKPTDSLKSALDFTYGSYNEVDAGGYVSGPISDTVTARFAFRHEGRDGWQHNYASSGEGDNLGVRDFTDARLLVDWTPSDTLKFEVNLNGWLDKSDTQAQQKIAYAPVQSLAAGGRPGSTTVPNLQRLLAAYPNAPADDSAAGFDRGTSYRRNDSFGQASLRGDLDLTPEITLTSITAFARLNVFDPNDIDGTSLFDSNLTPQGHITSYSEEVRLTGRALEDNRLKWIVGANYESDQGSDVQHIHVDGSDTQVGPHTFDYVDNVDDQHVYTTAGFADLEYEVIPDVTLQGAIRYTSRRDDFSGCFKDAGDGGLATAVGFLSSLISGSPTVIPPGSCVTLGTNGKPSGAVNEYLDERNVSYRAGISWKADPDTLVYANITKGYKGGAFDTLPALRPAQLVPVRQESVQAYEVGSKSFLFDRKVQLDGALFYYDYSDKQLNGYVNTGVPLGLLPALVSIPKSSVKGIELDAVVRPVAGLRVSFGGTYIKSSVDSDFFASAPLGGTVDIKGAAFPNTPKWQVGSDIEYDFPISSQYNGFGGLSLSYHSSTIATFAGGPLFNINPYTLLDIRVGVASDDGWQMLFWGHNITNTYYWTLASHLEDTVTRTTGMPATFGVTVSKEF